MNKRLLKSTAVLIAAFFLTTTFTFTSCETSKTIQSEVSTLTPDSHIKRGTLDNGMQYYIMQNGEPANRIVLRLALKSGSCNEDDDQRGLAHLIEHLCFNGTEHFQKSEIVDYFEKIGMNFGADLNAETSFDHTIYKLEIPADDPEILKTAFLILKDWASAVSFNQEEIDKERGVVLEEWRLRQGLNGRLSDFMLSNLLKDSRYYERLPIGKTEIIKNATRQRIVDYYEKWYKPELMAIVAVGDIKPSVLEKAIKESLGTIPASKDKIQPVEYKVPVQTEKNVNLFKDSEQKYNLIQIFKQKKESAVPNTEEEFKENLSLQIAASIFNQRMAEITMQPDSPWLDAGASESMYTNTTIFEFLGVAPKNGKTKESLKLLFDEYDRMMIFGPAESEVERAKTSIITACEQAYKTKDKIPSSSLASQILSEYLAKNIVVSEDENYKLINKLVPQITTDDIMAALQEHISDRGTIMNAIYPSSEKNPSQKELMEIWQNYKNPELTAYEENVSDSPFMEKPAKKAKISSKKKIKALDTTEYILENGIKIYTKRNTDEKDTIYMDAVSKGGSNLIEEKDIPSAQSALMYRYYSGFGGYSITEVAKKLSDKNMYFDFDLDDTTKEISGNSSSKDLEILLQFANMLFTQPQFTDEGWNMVMVNYNQTAESFGANPKDEFNQKILETIYGKTMRKTQITPEFVKLMDQKKAEHLFTQTFNNPADFAFTFVGDFDEAKLIDLCCYYLGTMPSNPDVKAESKYIIYPFPKNMPTETVNKGQDEKGTVYLRFGGELPAAKNLNESYKEKAILNQLQSLMNIRLREVIREDKSGSYSVYAGAGISGKDKRSYFVEISFGCDPSREQELTESVIEVIKQIQTEDVSADNLQKLKETYNRDVENARTKNGWWMMRIINELVLETEPLSVSSDFSSVPSWITSENIKDAANKYLDTQNYISVYLKPALK